jgi:hypothetical protein
MSEETNNTPDNIVQLPTEQSQQPASDACETPVAGQPEQQSKPTIQEMIASVDLTGATHNTIIVELIGEIQKLAFSATIALGLLERLNAEAQGDEQPSADEETK